MKTSSIIITYSAFIFPSSSLHLSECFGAGCILRLRPSFRSYLLLCLHVKEEQLIGK
jgi:hypothetical protein